MENRSLDISKCKDRDEDIEFYTGLPHWDALLLLNDLVLDKAQCLNYRNYKKKDTASVLKLGRPRAMTLFEQFVLT